MKKIFTLFLAIFISNSVNTALSFVDAGVVDSANVLDMRLHEINSRTKEGSAIIKKQNRKATENTQEKLKEEKPLALTDIKHVTFVNNSSIPSQELTKLIQGYINQPMDVQNVNAIRNEVMRYYQKKGYYSALAVISVENAQTGELVMEINEGGKNSIIIKEE